MSERIHVIAGRLTTSSDGETTNRYHGDAIVVCKPDDTVLVHDASGYQPVDWLTRADGLTIDGDEITAWTGDERLRITVHDRYGGGQFPASRAGIPVGDCPDCDGTLTRAGGTVSCLSCSATYGVPTDASVVDEACADCGLPRFRVARGETFTVCLDRRCDSLDERVAAAYDRAWDCPDCGDDLRVLRRGGLILGCASYPACDSTLSFPHGEVVGTCDCGRPVFETGGGQRCLDTDCERTATEPTPQGL